MNVGDKVSVSIQGIEIAKAEVKEVSDGTATLIVPATRVVMATKTELAPEVVADADTSGTEHIVDEVVRTPAAVENTSDAAPQPTNVGDAEKVISSSSVPTSNPGDPQNQGTGPQPVLDPKVQAQINEIVAAHLAAQAKAAETDGTQEQNTTE